MYQGILLTQMSAAPSYCTNSSVAMAAYGRDADDEESGTDGESAARSTEEQNGNECSLIVRDLTRGRDVSLVAGAWWRVRELKEAISATHPETPDPQTFEVRGEHVGLSM